MTRTIISLVLAVLTLAACGGGPNTGGPAGVVDPGKTFRWKMVTTWPANFPVFQEGAQKFADDVRSMSNGRLDIQVFSHS